MQRGCLMNVPARAFNKKISGGPVAQPGTSWAIAHQTFNLGVAGSKHFFGEVE